MTKEEIKKIILDWGCCAGDTDKVVDLIHSAFEKEIKELLLSAQQDYDEALKKHYLPRSVIKPIEDVWSEANKHYIFVQEENRTKSLAEWCVNKGDTFYGRVLQAIKKVMESIDEPREE